MAGIIASSVRPVFTFADEGLIEYEKIAAKKLADIIELLELGENANLQQDKRVYLPDDIAQISYTVMEGILEPIILVDIQRQDPKAKEAELEEQDIAEDEEEERFYYIPRFEVYATVRNVVMNEYPGNNNCGFEGYPPEARLIGWEPEFEEGAAFGDEEYGYNHTVESLPGLSYANFFPTWLSTHSCQPGAEIDRRVNVGADQGFSYGDNLSDEGFFGDQDWHLTYGNNVVVSSNGMVACENGETFAHTTTDARRPLDQTEVDFTVFEEALSPHFWHRSIVVGGVTFGTRDINTGEIPEQTHFRGCTNIGEDPGLVGEANGVTWTMLYSVEGLGGTVLPGEYEIQAFCQSYSCECMEAEVRIRLVLGGRAVNIEQITSGLTGSTSSNVKWTPIMEIVDIVPEDIGSTADQARFYGRDLVLGGFGNCDPADPVRGSLPSNSWGFWGKSLYVDPIAAKWRIGEPTWREPFYDDSGCITPGPCPESPNDPPDSPACLGCTGDSSVCQGSGVCSEHPYCLKAGPGVFADIRGLAAWSLARIIRVDGTDGKICQVQLIGNDTAQGGPCAEKSFSYGVCNFASGIDPSIPLGSDLSQYPNQGIIGGWAIGEVVVVIGYSNPCTGNCDGSFDYTGDSRWLVTKTTTGTDDFLSLFWKQLRCPGGIGFDKYLNTIIEIGKIQEDCGQLAPDPVTLKFEDGCIKKAE